MIIGIVREKPEELALQPYGAPEATRTPAPAKKAAPAGPSSSIGVRDILKNPVFWILSLGLALMAACSFGVRDHLVLYLRDLNFSPATSALSLSLILGASVAGRLLSGLLSDRFSARKIIVFNFLLGGLSLLMLLFISGFMLAYIFPILFGLTYGATINLKPLVIFEYFGTKKVGKVYGLVMACYVIGSAVGPLLTGYLFDKTQSYETAFVVNLLLACAAILAILVFAHLARPSRQKNYAGG